MMIKMTMTNTTIPGMTKVAPSMVLPPSVHGGPRE
jgi:hypothetical protein